MEICNKEYVAAQKALVEEHQEFQRELEYRVAKETRKYKEFLDRLNQ